MGDITWEMGQQLGLHLNEESFPWILNHIDDFVSQSRGNEITHDLYLYPCTFNGHDDEFWDKVGQAVGNLQALKKLYIYAPLSLYYHIVGDDDDDDDLPTPDWDILARIMSHVRQKIVVNISYVHTWDVEESRLFARAIHGHPTITRFEDGVLGGGTKFPYEASGALYSALATLPALESLSLSNRGQQALREDEPAMAHPESLTELLRVPSLQTVCFQCFSFTSALCQATANALMAGTAITKLQFKYCKFSAEGSAVMMAHGLSRNTSVSRIDVQSPLDQALYSALAVALPLNSTLQALSFVIHPDDGRGTRLLVDWSPIFVALGKNSGLKTLSVSGIGSMNEPLSAAMKDGIGMNVTLEYLFLDNYHLHDENSALWCRALSFLRTNKTLVTLVLDAQRDATESCLSAFPVDIVAMLQENVSLECLSVQGSHRTKAEDYFVLVAALQHNKALTTLDLGRNRTLTLTDMEDKQMAVLLKKNYALEELLDISAVRDVGAILRLNKAGRRYLVQDGSSISKGVDVLSRVNDDINIVFFHLLENPRLCDRSAVERGNADESTGSLTNPIADSDVGKRKQAIVHTGRESRRRLA
jgi:hypothetical protein